MTAAERAIAVKLRDAGFDEFCIDTHKGTAFVYFKPQEDGRDPVAYRVKRNGRGEPILTTSHKLDREEIEA